MGCTSEFLVTYCQPDVFTFPESIVLFEIVYVLSYEHVFKELWLKKMRFRSIGRGIWLSLKRNSVLFDEIVRFASSQKRVVWNFGSPSENTCKSCNNFCVINVFLSIRLRQQLGHQVKFLLYHYCIRSALWVVII